MKKTLLLLIFAGLFLNLSAVKKVAYVTFSKTMDPTATTVENDPIIQVLRADANFEVTVKAVGASDVISDLADYDVIIVQEGFGSGNAILKPTGSLALRNMPKPLIYNKTYALRNALALTTSTATASDVAQLEIKVETAAVNNELFKACTIGTSNEIKIFNAQMTDIGAPTGTLKSLNYTKGNIISASNTLLAQPSTITDAVIAINDIPAGSTIDNEPINSRMIIFNMNFGAICGTAGRNITDDGLTIWRNAVYILAELPVPSTKAQLTTAVPVTNEAASKVISVDYYTVNGIKVFEPTKGIYIKRITFENGTQKLDKVVLTEAVAR